ncbi:MAG: hypothetical protein U0361_03990 [Nitrospiraceae bacterium]
MTTAPHRIIHVITRLDYGGSAQNTMVTALRHSKDDFAPMVIAGFPEGGMRKAARPRRKTIASV